MSAALAACGVRAPMARDSSVVRAGPARLPAAAPRAQGSYSERRQESTATRATGPGAGMRPSYGAPARSPLSPLAPLSAAPGAGGAPTHGPASVLPPPGPAPTLRCAIVVPDFHIIFGESLAVAGAGDAFGNWDAAAAPRLIWRSGDTWSAEVRLPAGTHRFKLVVVRQDGYASWEEGPDREIEVPHAAAAVAAKTGTGLAVTCRWADAGSTDIALASGADLARLAPAPPPPGAAGKPAAGDSPGDKGPGAPGGGAPGGNGATAAAANGAAPKMTAAEALARAARILEPGAEGAAPAAAPAAAPQWQAA